MKFGKDFFKILNLVVQIMRMFAKIFGEDEDKTAAFDSETRSKNPNSDDAC